MKRIAPLALLLILPLLLAGGDADAPIRLSVKDAMAAIPKAHRFAVDDRGVKWADEDVAATRNATAELWQGKGYDTGRAQSIERSIQRDGGLLRARHAQRVKLGGIEYQILVTAEDLEHDREDIRKGERLDYPGRLTGTVAEVQWDHSSSWVSCWIKLVDAKLVAGN